MFAGEIRRQSLTGCTDRKKYGVGPTKKRPVLAYCSKERPLLSGKETAGTGCGQTGRLRRLVQKIYLTERIAGHILLIKPVRAL
ncbi:hypothetical protein GCM10023306_26060 [Novosphingobium ginsenosidimutans]